MENKLTRFFKVTIALFAVLLLGVIGGFITTVGAEAIDDVVVVETENHRNYYFYPNGYSAVSGELIEFTGTYVLTGSANTNVAFTSENGESVTYNVILHQWDAYAKSWHGLLSVDAGVTLNLTVYGENRIFGDNHPGIAGPYAEEVVSWVNITLMENSSLSIGYRYYDTTTCVHPSIGITLNSEATSSLDMSNEAWRAERSIDFTRGTPQKHDLEYTYVDNDVCYVSCEVCDGLELNARHNTVIVPLDSEDENAATKHSVSCKMCEHSLGLVEHSLVLRYDHDEKVHSVVCTECDAVVEEVEHNIGESGCVDCKAEYVSSVTLNGETTNYFEFGNALEVLRTQGGTLKLLKDFDPYERAEVKAENADAVLDLNGFKLSNTGLKIDAEGVTLTVIDSSEEKTGELYNNSWLSSSCSNGTIEYNGITISYEGIAVGNGTVIFNNVKVIGGGSSITIQSPDARVEINQMVVESELSILLHLFESYNNNVVINSGSFSEINLYVDEYAFPSGAGVTLFDMLPNGYAFANENGIVDAHTVLLREITAVVEHAEHTYNGYLDLGYEHISKCECGKAGGEKETHSIGNDGLCAVCGVELAVEVTVDGEKKYFASLESAFDYANTLERATIKLLRSISFTTLEASGDITFDLNGYETEITKDRIYIYGKLTLIDSSEAKTGKITSGGDMAYILQVENEAALVINGGEVFGLIYAGVYINDTASIEINGGKFTSKEVFRLGAGSTLIINGGWFENEDGVITYWNDTGISVTINGGVFVNSSLISQYSSYIPSAQEILGALDGCELVFTDENGNEIEFEDLTQYIEGRMIVSHKGAEFASDKDGHKLTCATCSEEIYFSEHHSFAYSENESDKAMHNVACGICNYELEAEEHTGGEATCTELAECEHCGVEYGRTNSDNHRGGKATCAELAKCERCGTPYGEYNSKKHTSKETRLVSSGNKHNEVKACCGEVIKSFDHKYDSICDTECNECKGVRKVAHTYGTDGKCISCGAAGGNVAEPKDNGLSTGAIVGTTIGTVVVFGGGAFALIWFVIRKKYI